MRLGLSHERTRSQGAEEYSQFNHNQGSTFYAEDDEEGGEMVDMAPTSSAMHSSDHASRPDALPGTSPNGLETVQL